MWQGEGIISQNWPNLIWATSREGNKSLQISRLSTIPPAKNYLYLWSRISPSCAHFLSSLPYKSLSPTKLFLYSLCAICSESVVEFKRPISCLLLLWNQESWPRLLSLMIQKVFPLAGHILSRGRKAVCLWFSREGGLVKRLRKTLMVQLPPDRGSRSKNRWAPWGSRCSLHSFSGLDSRGHQGVWRGQCGCVRHFYFRTVHFLPDLFMCLTQ